MDSSLINSKKNLYLNEHTYLQVIVYIITVLVYVLCIVYCFMHAYDRSLINITLAVPCLVSINSSSDDLIESEHYMLIPMQHISVPRIFSSLCINPGELPMQITMFRDKES